MKSVLKNFAAFLLLIPILALGAWLFFLGREVSTGLLRSYYVGDSFLRSYQAGFLDKMLTLSLGIAWMILFVVSEELMRRSAAKGRILKTFSRFFGAEALLAAALDSLMLFLLTDPASAGWARWLIVAAELTGGAIFVFLGWSKRSPWYEKTRPGVLEKSSSIS